MIADASSHSAASQAARRVEARFVIHPADAERRGITDSDTARVFSARGEVRMKPLACEMPSVLASFVPLCLGENTSSSIGRTSRATLDMLRCTTDTHAQLNQLSGVGFP